MVFRDRPNRFRRLVGGMRLFWLLAVFYCHLAVAEETSAVNEAGKNNGGISPTKECVVLLHGLSRTSRSMQTLAEQLVAQGYSVVNHDYPSRQHTIEALALTEIPKAVAQCQAAPRIHFVAHSLGGIMLRYYLRDNTIPRLGRTLMLGPPNQGSEVVDAMKAIPGFVALNGPAVLQLGTDKNSLPLSLGPVNFEVGVIAGSRSINLILSNFLPNPDDGKVSVASTKVAGMADHITLPVSHPFLMSDPRAVEQAMYFLQQGKFRPSNTAIKAE